MAIRFDNRVAIVTGAAGGIGFAVAEELARRGARLLVNDYGGNTYGDAGNRNRAEEAAERLRSLGAQVCSSAVAVGTPQAAREIVASALDAFGRLDILVNNAGITLPGLITDYSDEEVEHHFRVNLLGAYALVRAAWPHMRDQGFGRILNTSSNSALGIGANAPYSTAKAGLLGLTLDAAIEGAAHGILVNAMMPVAYTRMIEQIPDQDFVSWMRKHMSVEKVARSIVYLLSPDSAVTGRVFATGGGRLARLGFAEGRGWLDLNISPESVSEHIGQIEDMENAVVIDNQADEMGLFAAVFPFANGTRLPALDQDAVVGANAGKSAGIGPKS